MDKRRFTYTGGSSRKFWEIELPTLVGNSWSVRVRYGRIGTWGQEHTKIYISRVAANTYYQLKVAEKIAKGYKETGQVEVKKNVVNYTPDYIKPAAKVKPCAHETVSRSGNTWKCIKCGNKVEFDKAALKEEIEVVAKVRRYFDLSE